MVNENCITILEDCEYNHKLFQGLFGVTKLKC